MSPTMVVHGNLINFFLAFLARHGHLQLMQLALERL